MKKLINICLLSLVVVAFLSCDKGAKTPEGLVKMYVHDVTTKSVGKDYFEKYTSGKMLESIQNLSDEEFSKFIDLKKIKNAKATITSKNCDGDKCSVTYIVKYDVFDKDHKSFVSEVKKIATIVKSDEVWKIEDVTNIKTYHESTSPINAMED